MPKYEDFEIVVEKVVGSDYCAVNVRQPCGGKVGDASGSFSMAEIQSQPIANNGAVDAQMRNITILGQKPKNYSVSLTNALKRNVALEIGQRLSKALFKDEIRDCWVKCKQIVDDNNSVLRIRLDLSRAPDLASFPWEYLCPPGNHDDFLVLDKKVRLLRYLRTDVSVHALKVIAPLRILVVVSAPKDLPALATNIEVENIKRKLAGITKEYFELTFLQDAKVESLTKALDEAQDRDQPFHILHFIGHGAFNEEEKIGVLLFEDKENKSVAVNHNDLETLLAPYSSDLRVIVLNACEGARISPTDSYSGVASKIIQRAGIPAAIAMQFSITDDAAIKFAEHFYASVATGESLEEAVYGARRAVYEMQIGGDVPLEWATPVFYLRANDGRILDVKVPKSPLQLRGHYTALKSALLKGRLAFFLGLNVNLIGRPARTDWKPELNLLPGITELSLYLSKLPTPALSIGSIAELTQQLSFSGFAVRDEFGTIFKPDVKLPSLYTTFAKMVKKIMAQINASGAQNGPLFVTTTYDNALERAFNVEGVKDYHLICYGKDEDYGWLFSHTIYENGIKQPPIPLISPNDYMGIKGNNPVILKLSGEVAENSYFIATEDDFFGFARKDLAALLPPTLVIQLRKSRHIYLGYDIYDWPMRLLLRLIYEGRATDDNKLSYAVVFDDNSDPNVPFWRDYSVNPATVALEDYERGLEEYVLNEL